MKNTNIPTAKEFMLNNLESMDQMEVEHAMVEFAKMHVEAALKAAASNANTKDVPFTDDPEVDASTIFEAYPLENIK